MRSEHQPLGWGKYSSASNEVSSHQPTMMSVFINLQWGQFSSTSNEVSSHPPSLRSVLINLQWVQFSLTFNVVVLINLQWVQFSSTFNKVSTHKPPMRSVLINLQWSQFSAISIDFSSHKPHPPSMRSVNLISLMAMFLKILFLRKLIVCFGIRYCFLALVFAEIRFHVDQCLVGCITKI